MITVGIDLGQKGVHHVAIRGADGETDARVRSLGWDPQEWDQWATAVESRRQTATESIQVMMEPTGTAWVTLGQWCVRRGWTAYLVKSQMVSDLRKFYQHHVKNDRVDAWTLAQIPWLHPTAPMPVTFDRPGVQALLRWTKRQHQLAQQIRRLSQGIQAKAEACVPGISALFPNLDTHLAEWVYGHALQPFTTQHEGAEVLEAALHACGDTWAKRPIEEVSRALWTLITRACAIYGTPDDLDWDARVAEIQGDWELLTLVRAQHQAAIRAAREAYETLSPERPLESLYGVGRQGAAVFTAALASHTFATADKFRGYTGLIPRVKESGLTLSRGQQITKAGPRWLKAQLYVAAETARRYDPQLAVIYYRERVHKGHGHTQAVVTVATHLADRIWKVYRTGQPYELRDVEGRPVTSAEARALIAERWTVPKTRRRPRQAAGLTVGGVAAYPEGLSQTRETPASA